MKHLLAFIEDKLEKEFDYLSALEILIYELTETHLPDVLVLFRFLTTDASERIASVIDLSHELDYCIEFIRGLD